MRIVGVHKCPYAHQKYPYHMALLAQHTSSYRPTDTGQRGRVGAKRTRRNAMTMHVLSLWLWTLVLTLGSCSLFEASTARLVLSRPPRSYHPDDFSAGSYPRSLICAPVVTWSRALVRRASPVITCLHLRVQRLDRKRVLRSLCQISALAAFPGLGVTLRSADIITVILYVKQASGKGGLPIRTLVARVGIVD
ncbi:hypothetical protein B0T10DRAFT_142979 [Thelonectria olida]|uniref:Uncharacterized protein n=1 Tax=Thelonectria olida TaxID=1576542 RepID=A0A9P8VZH6_9HYPO|nr:hypothetical protein B0T10DRAFT_142979 [Thelonectria olida]